VRDGVSTRKSRMKHPWPAAKDATWYECRDSRTVGTKCFARRIRSEFLAEDRKCPGCGKRMVREERR
jgi:hypothetical protein